MTGILVLKKRKKFWNQCNEFIPFDINQNRLNMEGISMKKIVINGCWVGTQVVGVSRYALNLVKGLDSLIDKKNCIVELVIPKSASKCNLHLKNVSVVTVGDFKSKKGRMLWEQLVFPFYVMKEKAIGVDLTLSFPIWGMKYVAIHDCIYETFPENYEGHEMHRKLYLWRAKRVAYNKRVEVITVSQESKNEIMRYYDVSPERIHIIGNGWEHMEEIKPDYSVFEKIGVKRKYFFALGSKYKHKNLAWIIKTAKINPQYEFVLTGNNSFSNEYEELKVNKLPNVIFTGFVSDNEMKALMLECEALIQPSFYEGFGIPPLEALSLGKRIIVSNTSCLPEIYTKSAYYIDPHGDGANLDSLLSKKVDKGDSVLKDHSWAESSKRLCKLLCDS